MIKLLQLRFLPASTDLALLVLRLWLGLTLLLNHGWGKVANYATMSEKFPDLLGLGAPTALALSILAEVVASAFVVAGLFTRLAALVVAINMGVAFVLVHKLALSGPSSGELAFLYLAGFAAIFLAGPGRFSADARLRGAP